VRAMILSGLEAEKNGLLGRAYVDLGGPHAAGDRWLDATRARLVDLGYFCDVNPPGGAFGAADRFDAPVLYFGWYAGTVNGPFLREGFRFPPGAIALHIHSFSAGTLRDPSAQWCAPFVARGVAATFGNVFEPYLEFTLRPDLLLARLVEGATLGDAAYFATPVLGWQGVVLGDPLYRPFTVRLEEQIARLGTLPPTLAGYAVARQAAVSQKLGVERRRRRPLVARGVDDLHPDGGEAGIVGEADPQLRLPGRGGDLHRVIAEHDAGRRRRHQLAARERAGNQQRNSRGENLETQHDALLCGAGPDTRGYGWQSVNKTRYYQVDAQIIASGARSGGALEVLGQRPIGQRLGQMQPADGVGSVEIGQRAGDAQHPVIAARR